jgi:glycosyltransferase 2 family protein
MSRNLKPLIKICLTLGLLALLLRSVDLSRVRANMARMDLLRVAMLLVVHWLTQAITAQRWRVFARSFGIEGSYTGFVRIQFAAMFFNLGLPSLVGGDMIKAYSASRRAGVSFRYGLASVLQDRAIGLAALLFYGSATAIAFPLAWNGVPLIWAYGVSWVAGAILVLLVWKGDVLYRQWVRRDSHSPVQRVLHRFADFHESLAAMHLGRAGFLQVIALSLANSALVIWIVNSMCGAAGYPLKLLAISALVPLIDVLSTLPLSFNGVGIREWGYVHGLPLLGVPADAALAISLSLSALLILRNLSGALFVSAVPVSFRTVPRE